jgi:hypothetical protein
MVALLRVSLWSTRRNKQPLLRVIEHHRHQLLPGHRVRHRLTLRSQLLPRGWGQTYPRPAVMAAYLPSSQQLLHGDRQRSDASAGGVVYVKRDAPADGPRPAAGALFMPTALV